MSSRLTKLREWFKKPLMRYAVLLVALGGALYFLRSAPIDVAISVDIERTHRMGDGVLRHIEVKVTDADGGWISTSAFEFPEALYPDGPGPLRTDPHAIELQLPAGTYRVSVLQRYRRTGVGPAPPQLQSSFDVEVRSGEGNLVVRP